MDTKELLGKLHETNARLGKVLNELKGEMEYWTCLNGAEALRADIDNVRAKLGGVESYIYLVGFVDGSIRARNAGKISLLFEWEDDERPKRKCDDYFAKGILSYLEGCEEAQALLIKWKNARSVGEPPF